MTVGSWLDFPVKHSRVRIALLRIVFRRRWWVQIRGRVYILREPHE